MCFAAGTKVLMADGSTKPIEDIALGDLVWSDDPEDGEPAQSEPVEGVYRTETHRLFHIQVDGAGSDEILATGTHPFWTRRGWVDVEMLRDDDVLSDASGADVAVRSVVVESREVKTFNFAVARFHTYFVVAGDEGLLVHNQHPLTFTIVDPNGATRVVGNAVSAPMSEEEAALGAGRARAAVHTEARVIRTVPLQPGETLNMEGVLPPCTNCRGAMNALTGSVPGTRANYTWFDEAGVGHTWSSAGGARVCP